MKNGLTKLIFCLFAASTCATGAGATTYQVCRSEEKSWCDGEKSSFSWSRYEVPSQIDTSSVATCLRYCGVKDEDGRGPHCVITSTVNEPGGAHGHNLFTVDCH
jgi:hypothetical protein